MRRRSKKQEAGAGFSLFSYLDGLLCTMGALIIVLICISRGARFSHKTDSGDQPAGPTLEALTEELQNTEWRTKHMLASRDKTLKDLQDARSQLSHLEEHSARLRKEFEELVAAEKALEAGGGANSTDERLRAEVVRLRKAVTQAQADLDEARKRADSRKPSYAIVPYQGPNQTRRRPIYVECTGDRVILQPEGIELTPNDFAGPLGAGNPLAAALRAEREYLYDQQDAAQPQEEPYPLLLIRPDGINMYVAAREAMSSWSSDFGYELIDQDWKLEYQPPNKELAEITQTVVDEARVRQQLLARQMPREAAKGEWYHAGNHGVVRDNSMSSGVGSGPGRGGRYGGGGRYGSRGTYPGGRGANGLGDGPGRGNGVGNSGRGQGGSADSTAGGGYGSGGAGRSGAYPTGDGPADGPNPYAGIADGVGGGGQTGATPGGQSAGSVGGGIGGLPGGRPGGAQSAAAAGSNAPGGGGPGATGPGGPELVKNGVTGPVGGQPGGASGAVGAGPGGNGSQPGNSEYGAASGQAGGAQSMASAGGAGSGASGGQAGSPNGAAGGTGGTSGSGQAGGQAGGAQSASAGGSTSQGGATSAGGIGATSAGGMPNIQIGTQSQPTGSQQTGVTNRPNSTSTTASAGGSSSGSSGSAQDSIASKQGKDWALPEESRHAVPIARPVVVECRSDKLIVHADGATSKVVKEIPMQGATADSINELVGTVSQQAATWGAAGRGMYWRPTLSMQVAPGGEARYSDLQKLMADSGLDVRPMQAPPKQVAKPKRWFGLMK